MSDDLRDLLDAAGRRPAEAPDPAFADALEARLLAVAASLPGPAPESSPSPSPAPARPSRRPRWLVGAGLLAASLAFVAILLAGSHALQPPAPSAMPGDGVALVDAVNVDVVLPDGTVLEDPGNVVLPLGAVVRVHDGGSATLGDTRLRPGDVATLTSGFVDVVHGQDTGPVSSPKPRATPRPTPRPTPGASTGSEGPSPSALGSPTPSGSTAPGVSPIPSAPPAASPTPRPSPTSAPGSPVPTATPRPTPTSTPATVRPRLRARLVAGPRIAVRWTATWNAASYVLVITRSRTGSAPDPVYPGAKVSVQYAAPPVKPIHIRVPDGVTEFRLMVVALRADGSVLRRSTIVVVAIPVIASASPAAVAVPS